MNYTTVSVTAGIVMIASAPATADLFQVDVVGEVDFGGLGFGTFAGITSGQSATMSFQLDSEDFLDGAIFPTRGYAIDTSSFSLTVNGNTVGMPNPYPAGGTPYFIIRNNDPGVDGFLLGSHPDVAFDDDVWIDERAQIDPLFKAKFLATYGADLLPSLDIKDAVGTYDFTGLSVFNWGLTDAGLQPVGFIFDSWTIAPAAPACPADLDGDSIVNAADLAILLGSWGSCARCAPDLDGDGIVTASDLAILLGTWGPCIAR